MSPERNPNNALVPVNEQEATEEEKPTFRQILAKAFGRGADEGAIPPKPWRRQAGKKGKFTRVSETETTSDHPWLEGATITNSQSSIGIIFPQGVEASTDTRGIRVVNSKGEIPFEGLESHSGWDLPSGSRLKKSDLPPSAGFETSLAVTVGEQPQPPEKPRRGFNPFRRNR